MNAGQLCTEIGNAISPYESLRGESAQILLLATSAQESHCGEYLRQIDGPALGPFQMEPNTLDLVVRWTRRHFPVIAADVFGEGNQDPERLVHDVRYATLASRLLYYSIPEPIPAVSCGSMWLYYKRWYNTPKGAATETEWNANWRTYVVNILSHLERDP